MLQDFYSKLSDKEKKVFYVAVGMVSLALMDSLFMRPVTSRIRAIDSEIKDKKETINRDMRFLAYKDKILKEQQVYSVYNAGEKKAEEEIIAGFLKTVELLASKAGINLVKLNPAESEDHKGYKEYYATLQCSGKISALVEFMDKIDTTKNLLRIVTVDMTGNKASPDEINASMKIAKLVINPKTSGNVQFTTDKETGAPVVADSKRVLNISSDQQQAVRKQVKVSSTMTKGQAVPKPASAAAPAAGARKENSPPPGTPGAIPAPGKAAPSGSGTAAGATPAPGPEAAAQAGSTGAAGGQPGQAAGNAKAAAPAPAKGQGPNKPESKLHKDVASGGRMHVANLRTLWYRFIGKKPPPEQAPTGPVHSKSLQDEVTNPNYKQKPNLWERLLDR